MATDQALAAAPPPSRAATATATGQAAPRRILDRPGALVASLTTRQTSLHAAAVLRIGYGALYLAFLLREFPHRQEIWGPEAPWTPALARQLFDQTGWISILTLSDSPAYFESCYVLAVLTATLFMLGWRTRVMSLLFAAVVASFHARAIFMSDGGDNVILLMSLYLCCTACGRRWSLDARRARRRAAARTVDASSSRTEPGLRHQVAASRRTLVTTLHNCGMFVIAAQVCFLYGSAGLYKVQGSAWGDGTALHYVLNLDLFRPWPALSLMLDNHQMAVAVASYLTVILQVAFPFVLFGRLKYIVLAMLLSMHAGIAVLLGLPLFSGAMIIADAVFLPDRFYGSLGSLCRRAFKRAAAKGPVSSSAPDATLVPPQPGRAG